MTAPWGNPPQLPGSPRVPITAPITVPVKACCPDLLHNDVCDCAAWAAEVMAAFSSPIRWHATPDGVEAQR